MKMATKHIVLGISALAIGTVVGSVMSGRKKDGSEDLAAPRRKKAPRGPNPFIYEVDYGIVKSLPMDLEVMEAFSGCVESCFNQNPQITELQCRNQCALPAARMVGRWVAGVPTDAIQRWFNSVRGSLRQDGYWREFEMALADELQRMADERARGIWPYPEML